jgi:hypothetical protein
LNLGSSASWNPQGLSRLVMGLLYLLHWNGHIVRMNGKSTVKKLLETNQERWRRKRRQIKVDG